MINIDFLISAYIVAMFVDWVFQDDYQASNKSRWGKYDSKLKSADALISHSLVYATLTSVILLVLNVISGGEQVCIVYFVLFVSHIIIDSRIPVRWIMKLKGMSNEQIYDYQNYGFMHVGVDHRLHEIVLLLLSLVV